MLPKERVKFYYVTFIPIRDSELIQLEVSYQLSWSFFFNHDL